MSIMSALHGTYYRQNLRQALALASSIAAMLMLYQTICILLSTESPVVVVLSGSMKPAFQRGDILFLSNYPWEQYKTGDIIIYKLPETKIPIVHRVMETHDIPQRSKAQSSVEREPVIHRTSPEQVYLNRPARDQLLLTKGDNNPTDDIQIYKGLDWLQRKHVIGRVRGFLPFVGYLTIAFNEIPALKYAIFAFLGITTFMYSS